MKKAGLWFTSLLGAVAIVVVAGVDIPRSRVVNSPLTRQMDEMRKISIKIGVYYGDLSPEEARMARGKSVQDLVAVNALSAADAEYFDQHKIKYFGYDPDHAEKDVPLFEGDYPVTTPHWRIVVYSDFHLVPYRLDKPK